MTNTKKTFKFEPGDKVFHKIFGEGIIDEIAENPFGEIVYLISMSNSNVGRSVEIEMAHREYNKIKGKED
jgi:hypothetical protein